MSLVEYAGKRCHRCFEFVGSGPLHGGGHVQRRQSAPKPAENPPWDKTPKNGPTCNTSSMPTARSRLSCSRPMALTPTAWPRSLAPPRASRRPPRPGLHRRRRDRDPPICRRAPAHPAPLCPSATPAIVYSIPGELIAAARAAIHRLSLLLQLRGRPYGRLG